MAEIGAYDAEHRGLVIGLASYLSEIFDPAEDLWDCCPHGSQCWRRPQKPPPPHRFRVPFVGPRYQSRRILLVGMNSRDDGMHLEEFKTMAGVLVSLRDGRTTWGKSAFHYRAAILVSLLSAAQDGQSSELRPAPEDLIESLLASARVQAVQCAPGPLEARRGPKPPMWSNCPPLVVSEQIRALNPRVIVLLGTQTLRAIQRFSGLEHEWSTRWRDGGNCFARGTIQAGNDHADLFATYHPSAAGWTRSLNALRDSLVQQPLTLA